MSALNVIERILNLIRRVTERRLWERDWTGRIRLFQNGCSQSSRFIIPQDTGKEGSGNEIGQKSKIVRMRKNVIVLDFQGPLSSVNGTKFVVCSYGQFQPGRP